MNKNQAYLAMQQGHKVCNEYYSPEEYAFINDNNLIEYEDGCVVGNQYSENWVKYQDPEHKLEWYYWISKDVKSDTSQNSISDPYLERLGDDISLIPLMFTNPMQGYNDCKFYSKKEFIPKNHKRTNRR